MKYKTWEVVKMISENPKLRFSCEEGHDIDSVIGIKDGAIRWLDTNRFFSLNLENEYIHEYRGDGAGTLDKYMWELIQEPVDFMTALQEAKKGKIIKSEVTKATYMLGKVDGVFRYFISPRSKETKDITYEEIQGKWFVEEGEA